MSNPLIHWELIVADVERAKTFYGTIFEWTFQSMGPEYTLIQTGVDPGGGLLKRPPGVEMSALNNYFRVDDIDRTLARAVEAGAKVIVPRTEVPSIGWFAMFLDPEAVPVGVMQMRAP